MTFQLIWDGQDIYWHFDGAPDWIPLTSAAQFPDFSNAFDTAAPGDLQGCAPPFLTVLPEPGLIQIWTGFLVRTAEDWSVLVRGPANLATPGGYSTFEGIVETDRWFGPLFTNLRLTRTHKPITFQADFPLLQVQALPRHIYTDEALDATELVDNMSDLRGDDWGDYYQNIVQRSADPERDFGAYAVAIRKRRRGACPVAGRAAG